MHTFNVLLCLIKLSRTTIAYKLPALVRVYVYVYVYMQILA